MLGVGHMDDPWKCASGASWPHWRERFPTSPRRQLEGILVHQRPHESSMRRRVMSRPSPYRCQVPRPYRQDWACAGHDAIREAGGTTMETYVGIDVAKATLEVGFDPDGGTRSYPQTPAGTHLAGQASAHAAAGANRGGRHGWV